MSESTTVVEKKALKGFCGLHLWPVIVNTKDDYVVGEAIEGLEGQSLGKETVSEEYTIYANDDVYDTGKDYKYEDLTLGLAELPLDIEQKLQGCKFDAETKVYSFSDSDRAPDYALGYAAKQLSNNYRMFIHYNVKLMSVKVEHNTKGEKTDIAPYTLTLRNLKRKKDGVYRDEHDGTDKTYDWLDTAMDDYKQQEA